MIEYSNPNRDIYVFPATKEDKCIVYSPLRGVSLFVSNTAAYQIIEYFDNGIIPSSPKVHKFLLDFEDIAFSTPIHKNDIEISDKAIFLLSNSCNFACTYCYSQHSRNRDILDKETISAVVDYIFSSQSRHKAFSFLGGGEPTLTWDLLTWSVEYIKQKNEQHKFDVYIGLTTNGSLLQSRERISWVKKNLSGVAISFEILPDIQNKLRPLKTSQKGSFDIVDKAIKSMIEEGIHLKLRSTITKNSVGRMMEMLDFVQSEYPSIKELHLEPVCDIGENSADYFDSFITHFSDVYLEGRKRGVLIQNSITNALFHIREHYCTGEFCITPSGDIVSCHRFSTNNEPGFEFFKYGEARPGEVHIDFSKMRDVSSYRMKRKEKCDSCFAKWNCAGGCVATRATLTSEQLNDYCVFMKNLLKALLENTLLFNS